MVEVVGVEEVRGGVIWFEEEGVEFEDVVVDGGFEEVFFVLGEFGYGGWWWDWGIKGGWSGSKMVFWEWLLKLWFNCCWGVYGLFCYEKDWIFW